MQEFPSISYQIKKTGHFKFINRVYKNTCKNPGLRADANVVIRKLYILSIRMYNANFAIFFFFF